LALFPITRRKFIRLVAASGIAVVGVDSALLEPNHPRLVRRDIYLRRWPEALNGFTIALLSDFHYDPYFSVHPLKAAIPVVNSLKPDLIALAGDFVSLPLFKQNDRKAARAAEPCAALLRQMPAPYGRWAVLGNHDYYSDPDLVSDSLRSVGINVLINTATPVEAKGARFWLGGVNDVLGGNADLDGTIGKIPKGEATILLAHEPDYADYVARFPVDLQLSGHSHGGQVRIPLVHPFYLPDLARKYVLGMYEIGNLTLYTTAGLGTVALPIRFNCPPEITFITLRRTL